MSTPSTASQPAASTPRWLQALLTHRRPTAYGLFALTLLLGALTVTLCVVYSNVSTGLGILGGSLTLLALTVSLWMYIHIPQQSEGVDEPTRILLLVAGGLEGFVLFALGIYYGYEWWGDIHAWLQKSESAKNNWHVLAVAVVAIVGLFLMFVSVQLGRAGERSSVTLRRLLYGYNAVLTGVLLLGILTMLNVLIALRWNAPFDFTASSIYTLAPRSTLILKSLNKPVRLIHLSGSDVDLQTDTLLTNCREVSEKIAVESVALHSALGQQRAEELSKQFPGLAPGCLVVVYGTDTKDGKPDYRVIKQEDLGQMQQQSPMNPGGKTNIKFTGEDALMTELDFMTAGRQKPVIYFTQANRELDLNDRGAGKRGLGAGVLKERLEKRNYEVKPLQLSPAEPNVPKDAEMVVVAGPRTEFSPNQVKALRDFMKNKDKKLILLFDVVVDEKNEIKNLGLEDLLPEYNVQVSARQIFSYPIRFPPEYVLAGVNPKLRDNPLAEAFPPDRGFLLVGVRAIEPLKRDPTRATQSKFVSEPLLLSDGLIFEKEKNLSTPAMDWVREIRDNPEVAKKELIREPRTLAVAVSEPAVNPNDPHQGMFGGGKGKPRLLVFGNASLVSNAEVSRNFDLFASCLEWMRGREGLGIEAKVTDTFQLDPKTNFSRLAYLPGFLVIIGILGLGAGVWVVRRR